MLCLSGFELYFHWVPLNIIVQYSQTQTTWHIQLKKNYNTGTAYITSALVT